MRRVFIAEVTAYDPRADEEVVLHMCSGGQGPIVFDDTAEYVPCISRAPTYSISLTDNGVPGEPSVDYGSLGIRFLPDFRNEHWRGFDFDGYPCKMLWGEYGQPLSSYQPIPSGRVGSLSVNTAVDGELPILGPDSDLKKEVLKEAYGGTGAADGHEDFKGQLKPFTVGFVENIQPPMIDVVYLVYQYHGGGPTSDVGAVYENALTLGDAKYTVDTYEELIGLTAEQLPPGTWAKAPAVGMYRLGAEPTGKITADVIGANSDGEAMTTFGAIACWMLREIAGVPEALIDRTSAEALDRDFPHTWGNYLDSRDKPEDDSEPAISVGDFLREAASHLSAYMIADENGIWRFGRSVSAKDPTTLQQGRTTWPVVLNISKPAAATRAHKVRVGGRRCFSIHSDDEISSALKDAIEEAVVGIGKAVEDVAVEVVDIRKDFRSLVLPVLLEPIAEVRALQLEYGSAQLKASQALHKQNLIAISTLGTRVDENDSKVAEQLTQLTSRMDDQDGALEIVEAGYLEVKQTVANLDFASAETVETMIANYGEDVDAAFVEERRVRAEQDEALAQNITDMGVRVGNAEGKITELEEIVAQPDNVTAQRIEELGVRIDDEISDREAAIQTTETASVGRDNALSGRINTVSSRVDSVESTIRTVQQTETTNNTARANEIKTINSRLSPTTGASYEQNIQTLANLDGTVSSSVTFKVQTEVNGTKIIGGLGIMNQNGYVDTAFTTDAFSIWTPSGKQALLIADSSGVRMNTAMIGTLTGTNIKVTNASIDNLTISGDKFEPAAVTSVGSFERNYYGYRNNTTTAWQYLGGSYSNAPKASIRSGNGESKTLITCMGVYARDGGDDDNLNVSIERRGGDGTIYLSERVDVQVQSGNRTFAFQWVDNAVNDNTDYEYIFVHRKIGNDGSPYWYNVTFNAVCFKK